MPTGSKYEHLLEDKDVKRWYENLEAKSFITATVYLRTLGLYCGLAKTTPKKILAEASSKRFRDGFTDFIRSKERRARQDPTSSDSKRWFSHGLHTTTSKSS